MEIQGCHCGSTRKDSDSQKQGCETRATNNWIEECLQIIITLQVTRLKLIQRLRLGTNGGRSGTDWGPFRDLRGQSGAAQEPIGGHRGPLTGKSVVNQGPLRGQLGHFFYICKK